MTDLAYKPTFTAFDLLESGACLDGVLKAVEKHKKLSAATADFVRDQYVARAANASGNGNGYGYGYGDGYGYGSGYG